MHLALPEAGGASPLSLEGTFRRKLRDGVGQEGGAAPVTGGSSTDGPEMGGVGTSCTQEEKTPVSGALQASRAACPGLWGQILQSLLGLVKSLNLILKNDGKPREGLRRGPCETWGTCLACTRLWIQSPELYKPGVAVHAYKCRTQETEAGGSVKAILCLVASLRPV